MFTPLNKIKSAPRTNSQTVGSADVVARLLPDGKQISKLEGVTVYVGSNSNPPDAKNVYIRVPGAVDTGPFDCTTAEGCKALHARLLLMWRACTNGAYSTANDFAGNLAPSFPGKPAYKPWVDKMSARPAVAPSADDAKAFAAVK